MAHALAVEDTLQTQQSQAKRRLTPRRKRLQFRFTSKSGANRKAVCANCPWSFTWGLCELNAYVPRNQAHGTSPGMPSCHNSDAQSARTEHHEHRTNFLFRSCCFCLNTLRFTMIVKWTLVMGFYVPMASRQ